MVITIQRMVRCISHCKKERKGRHGHLQYKGKVSCFHMLQIKSKNGLCCKGFKKRYSQLFVLAVCIPFFIYSVMLCCWSLVFSVILSVYNSHMIIWLLTYDLTAWWGRQVVGTCFVFSSVHVESWYFIPFPRQCTCQNYPEWAIFRILCPGCWQLLAFSSFVTLILWI